MNLLDAFQRTTQGLLNARGVRSHREVLAGHRVHHYCLDGTGRGPPVLLVHGLGGSANGFAPLLFGLARRFRRIHALDLPGHGLSPEAEAPLGLRAQLALLQTFCNQRLAEPALVVGNSLGGALSIQLATDSPEQVRALALLSPAGAQASAARMEELWQNLSVQSAADARRMTARLFHRTPFAMRFLGGQMQHFYGTPSVRALIEDARREGAFTPELLGALKPPVLLWWGESERLLPYEGIEYFRAHLPKSARVEVIAGSGHVPQIEIPGQLIQRLASFADELGF